MKFAFEQSRSDGPLVSSEEKSRPVSRPDVPSNQNPPVLPPANASRPFATREFAYKLVAFFLFADWAVATGAIFCGLAFREVQRAHSISEPSLSNGFLLAWSTVAALVFVWLLAMGRTYEIKTSYDISQTLRNIFKAVGMWSLFLWAFVGLFRVTGFVPRLGAIYCMAALVILVSGWRLAAFFALTTRAIRKSASSRIIVIGWSPETTQVRDAMRLDVSLLGEVVGCVSSRDGGFSLPPPPDVPHLGAYADLSRVLREQKASIAILADTLAQPDEIQRLTQLCEREMTKLLLVLDYFPTQRSRLHIQTVSGVPLLGRNQLPIDSTMNRVVKRSIDIVGALVGLSICALVVPWFGLLVYIESPGPIIFKQRRTSRSGHDFYIYKIRSMRMHAEAGTGAVWCKADDDRRLRIGAFMRRWNVDELPQFYNVLVGDMSLVGPRPERPELIERFKDEIPSYNLRHEVRTGLTGWAQVQGLRGNTDLKKRIEADLYYLENWSVALDFYCIAATFFRVKNAY